MKQAFDPTQVKRPPGMNDAQVRAIAFHDLKAKDAIAPSKLTAIIDDEETRSLVTDEDAFSQGLTQFGTDLFTHFVFDPAIAIAFDLIGDARGWTPPAFAYEKLEVPTHQREGIPADYLAKYKAYGVTERQLNVVRANLRSPLMTTSTYTDVLVRPEALDAAVPIAECKPGMHVAALRVDFPVDYPIPVVLKILPLAVGNLIRQLRKHHGIEAPVTDDAAGTALITKHGVFECFYKDMPGGDTTNRIFYARFAPQSSLRTRNDDIPLAHTQASQQMKRAAAAAFSLKKKPGV